MFWSIMHPIWIICKWVNNTLNFLLLQELLTRLFFFEFSIQGFFKIHETPSLYFCFICFKASPSYLLLERSRPCAQLGLTGSLQFFPGTSRIQRLTCLHEGLTEPGLMGPTAFSVAPWNSSVWDKQNLESLYSLWGHSEPVEQNG